MDRMLRGAAEGNYAAHLNTWLPRLINLLLLAWLGWLVASHSTPWLQEPQQERMPEAAVAAAIPVQPVINTDEMASWHLFGKAGSKAADTGPDAFNAPETRLKLELKGIVSTDDTSDGYAIIKKPGGAEQHFRVDDSVFNLATLEEIYVDRIILLRNGKFETLRLPIEFMASDLFLEQARKKEARRIVTDFRQKLIRRDGMALIRMFGFEETSRNGNFVGFTIKVAGEDGARMLEVLGVEEGDLVTAVNGKRFSESLEAVESLRELKTAQSVDIEIDRKGTPLFFHFDFDDIEQAATEDRAADDNAATGDRATSQGESP